MQLGRDRTDVEAPHELVLGDTRGLVWLMEPAQSCSCLGLEYGPGWWAGQGERAAQVGAGNPRRLPEAPSAPWWLPLRVSAVFG